jgi:hypothetical protein
MPSAGQFAFLRGTVRNHPVIAATSAATGGVLLGAFVAFQLLATPQPGADGAPARAAVETKAAPKPVAETTGSASARDSVASADCGRQTWPYLSDNCMEEVRNKNRGRRVISTDKLDKPTITAIETPPPPPAEASARATETKPTLPSAAPAVASTAQSVTTTTGPATASFFAPPAANPVALAPAAVAAPEPLPATAAAPDVQVAPTSVAPAAKNASKDKQAVAKKAKQNPKAQAKAKQDVDDDGEDAVARSDDRASDSRSRRVVERWTERDYNVRDSNGDGQRRVTVIRREGGGLLENLFGMGRDRD